MNELFNNLIEGTVQCYGCPIFDRLFQIVSNAAGAVYNKMALLATIIFLVLFAFFILNSVWQNIKSESPDPWYQKSVRPVIINSLIALTFLWAGVGLPRLITTMTFEPVAQMSLIYTQSMLDIDNEFVNEHVTYQPLPISQDGFFRPELRDKIILLMKTTITQFQSYMKLGIAIIDTAFTAKLNQASEDPSLMKKILLGIESLVKHVILLFVGIYIFWAFFKLFFKFCCYFADIILAMALFAFFFPISLILIAFRGADAVPSWISGLGKGLGIKQLKDVINAIVALAAAVITYTVIMVIIAKFFSSSNTSVTDIMNAITTGDVFVADLSGDNLATLSIMGITVLVYVINFITGQIPQVTKMILSAFNVEENNKESEKLAAEAMKLSSLAVDAVKQAGKIVMSGGKSSGGGE